MREFLSIAKALGDETRVRALLALRGGELCLCHLIQLLRLAPATLSKHMDLLVQAGLVERRKEGRWCYFRLAGRQASPAVQRALKWAMDALGRDPTLARDAEELGKLRNADLKELSACYKSSKCCSSAPATPAGARWPKAGRGISMGMSSSRTRRGSRRTASTPEP